MPENVTRESSRAASAGPIPLTRLRFATEPKGPRRSRSAMMRRARTGPTPGKASSSLAVAISTSIFDVGNASRGLPLGVPRCDVVSRSDKVSEGSRCLPRGLAVFPFAAFTRRAESTAASWFWRARLSACGSFSIVPTARSARTDAPRRATLAMKRSAFFSAGVGMPHRNARRDGSRQQTLAARINSLAADTADMALKPLSRSSAATTPRPRHPERSEGSNSFC